MCRVVDVTVCVVTVRVDIASRRDVASIVPIRRRGRTSDSFLPPLVWDPIVISTTSLWDTPTVEPFSMTDPRVEGCAVDKSRRGFTESRLSGRRHGWWSTCFPARCQTLVVLGLVIGFYFFHFHGFGSGEGETLSYVAVTGTKFEADCRPFRFVGFNTHDLVQAASMTPYDYDMKGGKSGRARVRDMFREASASGLNVIRTWVHTNDAKIHFQRRPGVYEEATLRSLDYILDEARNYGIRVILSFVDNWKYYNGVDQYVDWSETTPKRDRPRPKDKDGDPSPLDYENEEIKKYETERHALFFTDPGCKEMYKNHIHAIVSRRNQANGALYRNDPSILAWDLINEPRCETWAVPECGEHLQSWLEEMASYLRSQDPNHLITIGSEGFFAEGSEYASHNPHEWAGSLGQDFMRNHAIRDIDFTTIHVWPNNWNRTDIVFQEEWVRVHIEASEKLGKPLLLEEFGKKLGDDDQDLIESARDPVYHQIYTILEETMLQSKNIYGSLFWRWNMPLYNHRERGEYGVRPSDSTFELIRLHADFVQSLNNALPPGQSCLRGCWVPREMAFAQSDLFEKTVNFNGEMVHRREVKIYPSKAACCQPGLGAFENGCSWSLL